VQGAAMPPQHVPCLLHDASGDVDGFEVSLGRQRQPQFSRAGGYHPLGVPLVSHQFAVTTNATVDSPATQRWLGPIATTLLSARFAPPSSFRTNWTVSAAASWTQHA